MDNSSDAVGLIPDGNPQKQLDAENFTSTGEIKDIGGDLALVVQCAQKARDFLTSRQWNLLWRDADLLFQSPRPLTVYENTYVLEPNVQRFTVAKIVNSIVPQLYKGLFYDDPPMVLRPRPGTPQAIVDAKRTLFSYILDKCDFKVNTKWGLEEMTHLGTGIWKWGIDWITVETYKRKATALKEETGPEGATQLNLIPEDLPPSIDITKTTMPMPFFEFRPLDKVLVDPKLSLSDIRLADWVVDVQYMDFYQLSELKKSIEESTDEEAKKNWYFPSEEDMKVIWSSRGVATSPSTTDLQTEQVMYLKGGVHHSEDMTRLSPDPLRNKLELLEYWDKGRKILVLNNSKVLFKGDNPFKKIPFLSANWWNRPKAFYGMGLGLIVGQNQRVDQGTINAILRILSYGVNPIYLRQRNANAPTQMIRTGIGKVLAVDGEVDKAYKLLETPKVPADVWTALRESEQATESSSGADQMLVQGSTAGPRSSMGRTAGGAAIQASSSATRLDGPLDNFIEQVFKPFLYVLDMLVFNYMSDACIINILGQESGAEVVKNFDMQSFHDAVIEYEILAGASMAARRTMAQSLLLITQLFMNPQIQENLADINNEYIDMKPVLKMALESSEWKNDNDIIKPMTDEMKQKRLANSPAALAQMRMQAQQAQNEQKFQQKQELENQSADNRIKRDLTVAAAKESGFGEAVQGVPSAAGIQGEMPNV